MWGCGVEGRLNWRMGVEVQETEIEENGDGRWRRVGAQWVLEGHGNVVYLDCDAENRCICISNLILYFNYV